MAKQQKRKLPQKKKSQNKPIDDTAAIQNADRDEKRMDNEDDLLDLSVTAAEEEPHVTSADTVTNDLEAIYYDEDDARRTVDMTTLEKKRGMRWWIVGVALLMILLGAAAYFGSIVFAKQSAQKNGDVELTVRVDSKVASGDAVVVEISYLNKKSVEILEGDIEAFYPDGFYFDNASVPSSDEKHRTWHIAHIKPGTGGKIRITGQLVGAKDQDKDFSALLTYKPSNFPHDFQVSAKASTHITSSIIDLEVQAPTQLPSGQEFEYSVQYKNTSKIALKNIKLVMNYPSGFTLTESNQGRSSGDNEWKLDQLDPGESGTLKIKGTLSGKSGETKEMQFQLGVIEIDNSFHVQTEKTSLIVMVNPEVNMTLSVPELVSPGDAVPVTLSIKNTSEAKLEEVEVALSFTGALFSEKNYTFKKIKTLNPQEIKELSYTVTLQTEASGKNQVLEVNAKVTSAQVQSHEVSFPDQETATMKVKGSASIAVEGRYYDDDLAKIGDGPIPPQVGEETGYVIRWEIQNGGNDLEGVSMKAVLPDGVTWKSTSIPEITYVEETRTVSYSQKKIDSNTAVTLAFMVSITPTADQANKLMVLTNETALSAIDAFTKQSISLTKNRVTTDLPSDEGAAGKGVVQP